MPEATFVEATRLALLQEMRRDPRVWVLGEDVARGGLFGQYRGVLEEFGEARAVSTPISESTIMGAGLGAALVGYVEATRSDDDEKNRLCPPSRFGNSLAQWAEMNVRGTRAAMAFGAEPDIAAWANACALNPARIEPSQRDDPAVQAAAARLAENAERGLARMAELANEPLAV